MRFHHYMMHAATRITGPQHNYLAIVFAPLGKTVEPVVVELPPQSENQLQPLNPDLVLREVLAGVAEGNRAFRSEYVVQLAQFVSDDTGPESVYRDIARAIVGETKRYSESPK